MDLIDYSRKQPGAKDDQFATLHLISGALFAVTFFVTRVFGWAFVS